MKQAVIMLATLGVLVFGTSPSGNASADIDSPAATVQASIPIASIGWAAGRWHPLGYLVALAATPRTILTSWRIGLQVGGLFGGLAGAFVGGAVGAF